MDRTATSHLVRARRRQAALMASCAIGLALAALPQAASAQDTSRGFQGTVGPGGVGSVTVTTGSQSTTIDVGSAQAVVNWTPTDSSTSGTIDFLPEDYSAAFISSNLSDYTVLNRILPGGTAKIGINGSITSSASNGDGGQNVGGNVWFYTPNGFVIGPRATIQVGGLVMTTNDIVFGSANTGGDDLTDVNGNVLFRGTTPGSSIVINPGAQIVGSNSSSYIALVSPRIEQGGYVSADRSIAYVAGNQVDLKINAGNFDIAIGEGTEDANGIVHTGTTTGTGSFGFGDVKTMHFVAVPKNTALTMLLSGSIGYTPATSSFFDGGSIVLTAGDEDSPDGNIDIGAARFRNNLNAHATGDITVSPPSSESVEGINEATFESFVTLSGDKSVHLNAVGGSSINATRGLSIYSRNAAGAGGTISITAGPAELIPPDPEASDPPEQFTSAGYIRVNGGLSADASGYGGTTEDGTTGLDAQGGSVLLAADGGTIEADNFYLYARGEGGFGSAQGGNGYGGLIDIRAGLGGAIYSSYLQADAEGHGGGSYAFTEGGPIGGRGGTGYGGAITVADSSGSPTDDPIGGLFGIGEFSLDVTAIGGNSLERASGLGGDAFGGTIDFTIDRQDQDLGYIYGYARAIDGDGGAEDPVGGDITMTIGGGAAVNVSSLYLDAGAEASVNSPAGAFAKGGTIDLTVKDGASLDVFYDTDLRAAADISYYFFDTLVDSTPDLTGGTVKLTADGGSFTTSDLSIDVSANNVGAATRAGFAQGGTAVVTAANNGSIATILSGGQECTECFFGGNFSVNAEGYGTGGTAANLVTGGNITLASESGGTISADSGTIALYAAAEYGFTEGGQPNGVTAQGGRIAIDALSGTIATSIYANATGSGGDADFAAGMGSGGQIDVRVLGGTLTGLLEADASGTGGISNIKGDGGDGRGGRFTMLTDADATFEDFSLYFYGDARGGYAVSGAGGDGFAGSAQVDLIGGTHNWSEAYLSAVGNGAPSYGEGSQAGSAQGAGLGLNFHVGGGADLTLSYLGLDARSYAGGDNADGNFTVGGIATLLVDQLASLTADAIGVNASGNMAFEERNPAGYGTTPTANGGTASVIADGGTITTPFLEVVANAMTGGAMTRAGSAVGGRATIGSSAGGLVDIVGGIEGSGELILEARGLGAEGPSAATASGGTARLYTAGGTISSVFNITVNANAEAGNFAGYYQADAPANGFIANGGIALVEMNVDGSGGGAITAPSLVVTAQGLANQIGPVQGTAGLGRGGIARLDVAQGTLQTGPLIINAGARGGQADEHLEGGAAYPSGSGTGGTAELLLSGGAVRANYVNVLADGRGGAGVGGTIGATASLAALGRGGSAALRATGGTLSTSSSVAVQAQGIGGPGAYNPESGQNGGDGSDAFGGTAEFAASGTAAFDIANGVFIQADAFGGSAGSSFDGLYGAGGDATAGSASMNLADVPFTFGLVSINAVGGGGFGDVLGTGTGGLAAFSLIDTTSAAVGPRTIGSLDMNASGLLATEELSVGGTVKFSSRAGSADSGLAITGDLSLVADGVTGAAGYGFIGDITGAPVTVGGSLQVITPRDGLLTIGNGGALDITGNLDVLLGGSFTSSGPIIAGGDAQVRTGTGISMTDLAVGGSTFLRALGGPVVVSHDLRSAGPVTVLGTSVNLVSLGALTFADADATNGDLSIETEGDLLLTSVDATGAVTLTSNAGSIHNTGAVNGVGIFYTAAGDVTSDTTVASAGALGVDAGGTFTAPGTVSAVGNVSLSADQGLSLAGVVSGGTTYLAAESGAVSIDSLTSPGLVTALGEAVSISSPGALSFASAQATAGDLALTAAGDLALAQGGASGALTLTSSGGSISGAGPIVAGGNVAVSGDTGISMGTLTSGGTTALASANGTVGVGNLNSAGLITASGTAITIGSSGALAFHDIDAHSGSVLVQTAGNLTVNTVDATGSITLTSNGGALRANGVLTGNGIALSSLADLSLTNDLSTSGPILLTSTSGSVSSTAAISSGASLTVSGNSGIALGSASSGGITTLTSANGAISVANLGSVGQVTAIGRAVDIAGSGTLAFANAQATAGDLALATAGNLIVSQAIASGDVSLASTAGSVISTAGAIAAGGDAAVSGQTGIALASLNSGGTTQLGSANGSVVVNSLVSAGAVTAAGRSVNIASPGSLLFSNAQATAGNLNLTTAGNLSLSQASASNVLRLTSTGGSVTAVGPLAAGGNADVSGNTGISLVSLTSGGITSLNSANGAIGVTNLNSAGAVTASGRSVNIGSSGALTFADLDATAGNIDVQTTGNLAVSTVDATGSVALTSTGGALQTSGAINANGVALSSLATLQLAAGLSTAGPLSLTSTSGAVNATGALSSGGNLTVSGNSGISLGAASSGGTTVLTSANGNVGVSALTSVGPVTASGRSVTIASPGALAFANAQATAMNGNLDLATTGNLSIAQATAANTLRLVSTAGSVTSTGAITSGGNANVSGSTGVSLASLASGGTTALTSANGAVNVVNLASTSAVTASGRSVTIGSTGGLTFADLDATAGNAAVQTAGTLAVGTVDATGSVTLTSTSGAVNATGALNSGGNLTVSGNSGISLGAANSGGTTSLTATNGSLAVANLNSAGSVTAAARAIDIASSGALSFANAQATAGDLKLGTAGNLTVAQGSATGALTLSSSGGSINGTGPVSAGGNVAASGQTGVTFASLASGGTTSLNAQNGSVAVTALTSAGTVGAAGRSVDLRSTGSLNVGTAQATAGNVNLQTGQNLTLANASATGGVALTAGGDLVTTGAVNGAIATLGATNVTIGGQVQATGAVDIQASQLFTLNGVAAGQTVGVATSDIAIGQTGRIGTRGLTRSITIRNLALSSPMNIGGNGQQGQFSLDKSEAARLFADEQITFRSRGQGATGDVRIGDLALAFGANANIGAGGLLKVDAGGLVEVNGAVALTTVSDSDAFAIDPTRINVIAGQGSIVMKNASGALQGILELQAGSIAVADQAMLNTIAALSDFGAISNALGTPGPAGPDGGYLQAGTINLIAGDSVYIQNSGASSAFEDRRGFRANELNIETESSAPRIAINGVILTDTGELIGLDTEQGVSINGVLGSELQSGLLVTINGCGAGIDCSAPEHSISGQSSDELEEILSGNEDDVGNGPSGQMIQVEENQPLITPPLVDEPITGVGNDDLWQVKCTPEGDKGACPTGEGTE